MTSVKTAFFIAYKSIRRGNRSALALTVFILTLSYFNLMFITGIMSGLTDGFVKTIIETGGGHVSVLPQEEPTRKQYIPNEEQLRARIETIPGVIGTSARYRLGATITYDPEKDGKSNVVSASIIAIQPRDEGKLFTIDENIVDGEYLSGLANDEILLSVGLAGGYNLPYDTDLGGVRPGDEVDVTFSNGIIRTYKIKGIFQVAGPAELSAFINAREAESILSVHDEASEIVVMAEEGIDLGALDTRITGMAPQLVVKQFGERLASVETFLGAFDLIAYIVSTISVAVAAVTIFVIIYVNAISRRRQIGILKAIGIKTEIIELSYVFQSIFYALSGVTVGLILVFLIIYPLIQMYPIPLGFGIGITLLYTPTQIVVGILALVIAGLLAGFVPARIVARQDILKAIWG